MRRPSRHAVVVQLLVLGLMVLLQVALSMSMRAAFDPLVADGDGSSQVTGDELADDLIAEAQPHAGPFPNDTHRWEHACRPPAPVHLEPEGRPPSA